MCDEKTMANAFALYVSPYPHGLGVEIIRNYKLLINFTNLIKNMKTLSDYYCFMLLMMTPTIAPTTSAPMMDSQSFLYRVFSSTLVSIETIVSVRSMNIVSVRSRTL